MTGNGPPILTRGGVRLEWRLPLLIFALLTGVLLVGLGTAYREVRQSAFFAADQRMQRVSQQLAQLARPGIELRLERLRRLASDPAVLAAFGSGGEEPPFALLDALAVLSPSAELPVELWSSDGTLRLRITSAGATASTGGPEIPGESVHSAGQPRLPPRFPPLRRNFGDLFARADGIFFWLAVPLAAEPGTAYLAQLQRLGNPSSGRVIADLVGSDAIISIADSLGGPWYGLDGESWDPAIGKPPIGERIQASTPAGAPIHAVAARIPGTPFLVVTETLVATILVRPNSFLRRYGLTVVGMLMLATIVAWIISLRITRPITELGEAARDLARGAYGRRAAVSRNDEIGLLASSFNMMAAQVERAIAEARTRTHEAQTANRAKSDFLATMSHEIRTPINAVLGYADLLDLAVAGPLNEQQALHLRRIRTNGRILLRLVDELLDLSKIEAGSLTVSRTIAPACRALQCAHDAILPQALARQMTIQIDCEEGLHYDGDPQRVEQILLNLLANAVKFAPAGGRIFARGEHGRPGGGQPGRSAEPDPSWIGITIEDSGPGIAECYHERIFEPFEQGETGYTRSHGGAGLGLAISRRLARLMGGDITVRSIPGHGAAFTLWLPAGVPMGTPSGGSDPGGTGRPDGKAAVASTRTGLG